jgi:hypothetical protein
MINSGLPDGVLFFFAQGRGTVFYPVEHIDRVTGAERVLPKVGDAWEDTMDQRKSIVL